VTFSGSDVTSIISRKRERLANFEGGSQGGERGGFLILIELEFVVFFSLCKKGGGGNGRE